MSRFYALRKRGRVGIFSVFFSGGGSPISSGYGNNYGNYYGGSV